MNTTAITPSIYRHLTSEVLARLDWDTIDRGMSEGSYRGSLEQTHDGHVVAAELDVRVRSRHTGPDDYGEIFDAAVVWAEVHTLDGELEETANDFSISELKHYIIGN